MNNVKVTGIPSIGYYSRKDSRLSTEENMKSDREKEEKNWWEISLKTSTAVKKGITRGEKVKEKVLNGQLRYETCFAKNLKN